jgi:mono/diheme cytochrome c family protein
MKKWDWFAASVGVLLWLHASVAMAQIPVDPAVSQPVPVIHAPPPPQPNYGDLPASVMAWDSLDKAVSVSFGTLNTNFCFSFTNLSAEAVTIQLVRTSCGCTTAKLPAMPWVIPAGSNDVLNINMNLAGKGGTVVKSVTLQTDKGMKNLLVRTTILPQPTGTTMAAGAREQNQMLALTDSKAIFKGDCASCHAEPAKGKHGPELYAAACGICHEAEHRASSVPDLKVAKQVRNEEYWRNWITSGKQGTMMPPFAVNQGGILTDEQIASLVNHLMQAMPTKPAPQTAATVPAPAH